MLTRHLTKSLITRLTRLLIDFDPRGFSGLQLWLDAPDSTTVTKDGANATSAVADKSGNGNNATQATGTAQPTYDVNGIGGLPTLVFDGSSDFLDLDSAIDMTNFTVFCVLNLPSTITSATSPQNLLFSVATTLPRGGIRLGETSGLLSNETVVMFGTDSTDTRFTYSTDNITLGDRLLEFSLNGTTEEIKVDGTQLSLVDYGGGLDSTNSLNAIQRIGANRDAFGQYLNASISEIIIYNRSLSSTERTDINNYLTTKYGL